MTSTPTTPPSADCAALDLNSVRRAMVHMGSETLEPTLSFFTATLGFRIDAIFPADGPKTALLSGHGMALQLSVGVPNTLPRLTFLCDDPERVAGGQREVTAPNGTVVRFASANPPMKQPPTVQSLVFSHADEGDHWAVGRAGLRYRDLLPERHGGAFIASHIRILDGGPVPDYVHYHKIRFQMIFCRKGWVRVLYEGQGGPMVLHAGDCVLQPPMIRHRVLESSAGAEVVEIGTPAEHITIADHELALPSPDLPPGHLFGDQRFVRHDASTAPWKAWRVEGFEYQDTGIGGATDGLAGVRVVRVKDAAPIGAAPQQHATEFCFYFVLSGAVDFVQGDERVRLRADDSVTVPDDLAYAFGAATPDLQLLEVTLPDAVTLQAPPSELHARAAHI